MASSWRNIRVVFLLQVAIVCLVVVLCMLGLDAANGEVVQPVTIAAIGIALLAIAAVTWMTYRATKRLLAPMDWLLREVARWDPQRPDTRALAPERIPYAVQGEVRMMADALHGLGERMDAYIARERDFTRDASHELRTPLTVIRVAADLIARDAALSERSRRSLGRIQGANAAMESLMDALLMLESEGRLNEEKQAEYTTRPKTEEKPRAERRKRGEGVLCACGGLLGPEIDGRYGLYRKCLGCRRNVARRDYEYLE